MTKKRKLSEKDKYNELLTAVKNYAYVGGLTRAGALGVLRKVDEYDREEHYLKMLRHNFLDLYMQQKDGDD